MKIEAKLAEMGIEPPEPSIPDTLPLRAWNVSGNLVYLSGAGPTDEAGNTPIGKVGRDFDAVEAAGFAQSIAVAHLGVLKDALGDLDRVIQIVKVLGMINCTEDFTEHPMVINGYSDLLVELWGENGRHARSAVGMAQLPGGMAVEIEAIVEFM
jgi:enamine deaminase RidA (YjgF/YER057c/UK114 family)